MKRIANTIYIMTVAIMVLLMAACTQNKPNKDGRTDTTTSGKITFACDESFSPIIDEQKAVYEALYPNTKIIPKYIPEVDGVNLLLKNKVWLTIAARNFTEKEKAYLKGLNQIPEAVPLAYDGMALICNNNNLDSCITVKDVKRILTGQVTNWNQVNKGSKLGEIWVCFDNKRSSAVSYCVDSILGGKTIDNPNIFAAKNSKDVIDYVARTPNAIGIIGSNWLNDKRDTTNTTWNKAITVMSVSKLDVATPMNSWKPYQAWLLNGRYPFVRTIYALLNDGRRGLPWGFAHFIESPKGQLIIFKSGLLPTRGEITIRDVNVSN
ncbi:PstS family phosphate ABC transporter substrate-binding protein [Prevotella sp.]|uniref:PstS family phosphate ABC transporter substrate-binding protein n=1 Tax=Prevotella sp. TaxID=59823 RepID=UPI0025F5099F|nr:substrate-binding domain-containing protein [Prevotella sp.]